MRHSVPLLAAAIYLILPADIGILRQPMAGPLRVIAAHETLQSSPAEASTRLLDPKRFGNCVWDGAHDVTLCIQAAVNAAGDKAAILRLPPGIWPLGQHVNLPANVTLIGERGQTILGPFSTNKSNPVLINGMNIVNVLIKNIVFDGGGDKFSNPSPLVVITRAQNVIFDNIIVQNTRGAGIFLQGGINNSGVRKSRFVHVGNYWKTTRNRADRLQALVFCCGIGNSGNFAEDNYFEDVGLDALQFSEQSRFTAVDNVFNLENNQHALINSPDFAAAIFPMDSVDSIITGNTISGAQGCGIDAPAFQRSTISRNKISNSQACGIGLFEGYDHRTQTSGISILGNTITNNVHWKASPFRGGITIAGGTPDHIKISRNIISDTQQIKTQSFGIQVISGTKVSDLKIDRSNKIIGNDDAMFDNANFSDP